MEWSPVLNSVRLWRAVIRCPVTTQESVQFSQADRVRFGISSPACLTGRRVIPSERTSAVVPLKRGGRKDLSKASSTGRNNSVMCRVAPCTKAHSSWRDFFRTTQAFCGLWRATLVNTSTKCFHPFIFSDSHAFYDSWSPMNPPR